MPRGLHQRTVQLHADPRRLPHRAARPAADAAVSGRRVDGAARRRRRRRADVAAALGRRPRRRRRRTQRVECQGGEQDGLETLGLRIQPHRVDGRLDRSHLAAQTQQARRHHRAVDERHLCVVLQRRQTIPQCQRVRTNFLLILMFSISILDLKLYGKEQS